MIYLGAERVVTNDFNNHGTAEDYSGIHKSNVTMYGRGKVVRVINSFISHEDSINYNDFLNNQQNWKDGNYYNCISITGKLVRMHYDELGGNQVFIETYDGNNKLLFRFAHLDSVFVKEGDIVDSSTVLGLQGNTGLVLSSKSRDDTTYGSHVHLEITNRDGVYLNPREYANGNVGTQYVEQSNVLDTTKSQFKVMVNQINIRESATTNSADIGDVYYGELYTILDVVEDDIYTWYKIITAQGLSGFVASKKGTNWVELYESPNNEAINDNTVNDKNDNMDLQYKLLFTCEKDGIYYLKLYKGEELYIKEPT